MFQTKEIAEKYKDKLLGVCNYKKDDGDFFVGDFQDIKTLVSFLYELETGECSLTKSGYNFLVEYYGLDGVASILLSEDSEYPYDNRGDTIEWLKVKGEYSIDE